MGKREKWKIRKRWQRQHSTSGEQCEICDTTRQIERHHRDGNLQNDAYDNCAFLCKRDHIEIHRSWGEPILSND